MVGCNAVKFSDLFTDTVNMHGMGWARTYYLKHGMNVKEFRLWCRVVFVG